MLVCGGVLDLTDDDPDAFQIDFNRVPSRTSSATKLANARPLPRIASTATRSGSSSKQAKSHQLTTSSSSFLFKTVAARRSPRRVVACVLHVKPFTRFVFVVFYMDGRWLWLVNSVSDGC